MPETAAEVVNFSARIRGMRSELFDRARIEELLVAGDVGRVIDALLESPYRKEMAEALTRYEGADAIEDAVSRNLVETFHKLLRMAQGDFKQLVRLFLTRWDLAAAKSVLRTRHHGISGQAAIGHTVPGPTLTVPLLHDMAELESMEAVVGALAAWNSGLCGRLRKLLPEYEQNRDLGLLEDVLDRAYFVETSRSLIGEEETSDSDAAALRKHLRMEIDRVNLRSLFQSLREGADRAHLSDRLLPEGLLSHWLLLEMAAAGDPAQAMERLASTTYRELAEELYQLLQTQRFGPIERYFDRIMMHQMRKTARVDVFGMALLIDYVWLKYNEVINLRLIARGLAGHLPTGRVREELYFV